MLIASMHRNMNNSLIMPDSFDFADFSSCSIGLKVYVAETGTAVTTGAAAVFSFFTKISLIIPKMFWAS